MNGMLGYYLPPGLVMAGLDGRSKGRGARRRNAFRDGAHPRLDDRPMAFDPRRAAALFRGQADDQEAAAAGLDGVDPTAAQVRREVAGQLRHTADRIEALGPDATEEQVAQVAFARFPLAAEPADRSDGGVRGRDAIVRFLRDTAATHRSAELLESFADWIAAAPADEPSLLVLESVQESTGLAQWHPSPEALLLVVTIDESAPDGQADFAALASRIAAAEAADAEERGA